MLRECHRVLKAGGRLAGYVIHTPDGLDEAARPRAAVLGPSEVNAAASPVELARSAGFSINFAEDVTADFRTTCASMLETRTQFEIELRTIEGDEAFEEEQATKRDMLQGIDEGVLQRTLLAATKP